MGVSAGPGLVSGGATSYQGKGMQGAPDTGPAFVLALSANIAASGENTTARLTAPAGKTTGDFGGGRAQDDENPGDAVDPASNQYREDEWCMKATSAAIAGGVYQFRLVKTDESEFDTYTVDPRWTIGSGRTLAADAGSFTITGTTSTLRAARRLTADAGSYTITGTDATLRAARRLIADAGAYAITGTDAILRAARRVSCEAGTYAITGQAATLVASGTALTIDAQAGSYAITGSPTSLRVAWRLTAVSGSYALTGAVATLLAARRMVAGPGSYVITGSDAAINALAFGTFIQAATAVDTSGVTATIGGAGWAQNITPGSAIILGVRLGNPANDATVSSDSTPGTLAKAIEETDSTDHFAAIYYGFNHVGGDKPTLTVDASISATIRLVAVEYAGSANTHLDKTASDVGTAAGMSSGATATRTDAVELQIGVGATSANQSFTAGSGFAHRSDIGSKLGIEDVIRTSVGTQAAEYTLGGVDSPAWSMLTATFSDTGGGLTLSAAAGAYAISGQPATLHVSAQRIDAAAGAYAISGQTATLVASGNTKILAAAAGSYAITGQTVSLDITSVVVGDQGAYIITGQAATLVASGAGGLTLSAQAGSYAITGSAAGLRAGWRIAAAAGSYAITGTAMVSRAVRRLAAGAGSYAITGQTANLIYSGSNILLAAGAGAYSLNGSVASLRVHRMLVAASGSVLITGMPATLIAGEIMYPLHLRATLRMSQGINGTLRMSQGINGTLRMG